MPGLSTPDSMAFAPSAPQTEFSCANVNAATLVVDGSNDSGSTWHTLITKPASASGHCFVTVDPTNARDVVAVDAETYTFVLIRSLDGGASWTQQSFAPQSYGWQQMGWAGSTLLLSTNLEDGGSPDTHVYASVASGPFTRIDHNGQFGGQSISNLAAILFGGTTSTYYAGFSVNASPAAVQSIYFKSVNAGATWTPVRFFDGARAIDPVLISPNGRGIVAVYSNAPSTLTVSLDGSQTWQATPAPPIGAQLDLGKLALGADGTLFAPSTKMNVISQADLNEYTTRPGAASWSVALTFPTDPYYLGATLDASGRVNALWATYIMQPIEHPL